MQRTALVTGAGGFIGGWLVRRLLEEDHHVVATDKKPTCEWWQQHDAATNLPNIDLMDLAKTRLLLTLNSPLDDIYHLAADMGGMGFIGRYRWECAIHNCEINNHLLRALKDSPWPRHRLFWTSSACAYPVKLQGQNTHALPEALVWQGQPEEGYGEEKLFTESKCRYTHEDKGIECHVVRLHNVYGPHGCWRDDDERTKAPAALCCKVAKAKLTGNHVIPIWGDGTRTRSFMYIDDCVEGIRRIMESDVYGPINLGSEEQVSICRLVDTIADIAGIEVEIECDMDKPQGVVGRNSDNTMIRGKLGWEPKTPLRDGLEKLYQWVETQVKESPCQ